MPEHGCVRINDRCIGAGCPVYIIAELSANHNNDFDRAVRIIHAAKTAGADAVKLQTYTADTMTIDCDKEYFRIGKGTVWEGRDLYELYAEACMPWEWQPKLKAVANALGMDCFSTPFDESSVDYLESMDVPAYKIASFELVDIPLIRRVAETGRPMIMSTGMASRQEIEEAVSTARMCSCNQIALLKCTSGYPALPEEMNLRTIQYMAETYCAPVGLSDHSMTTAISVAAVALGACIIEKHLTLSRSDKGPDSHFSLEPDEFKAMVDAVRTAEKALGIISYAAGEKESESRVFRRSLFVVKDIKAGEVFTRDNIRAIRPGYGLHTRHLGAVLGQKASRDIERGTPFSLDLVRMP